MAALINPTLAYAAAFTALAREYAAINDTRYHSALQDFPGFVTRLLNERYAALVQAPRVPQWTYWLVEADYPLGTIRIRPKLNAQLKLIGGHIGYDIRPTARAQGYGREMLGLALPLARQLGIRRAFLTCDTANIASARIIEHNGGQRERTTMILGYPKQLSYYWIELGD